MTTNNQHRNDRLFVIFVILFSLFVIWSGKSQTKDSDHYFGLSAGLDIRNASIGSAPTQDKPAIDVLYQFAIVSQNIEVNIGYECFNAIRFDKYSIGVGYHFPLYGRIRHTVIRTVFIPGIEPTMINRWGEEWGGKSAHLTIGGNLALRWHLGDNMAVELLANFLPRTDLEARYPELHSCIPVVANYYFKIIYKIQRS